MNTLQPIHIGLVDMTKEGIAPELVAAVAGALHIQVTRDLPQFWPVSASVSVLTNPKEIPPGVWPVQLVDKLPEGEGGFHLTRHNQPFARVKASSESDQWTVDASHEAIEMLVDPSGNRLQASRSIEIGPGGHIQDGPGVFEYLVEACDPCEADDCAYSIQGVAVSDFITPHFYDPRTTPGTRYSFTGALTGPRQIRAGGYISWIDPVTQHWTQLQFIDPAKPPRIVDLGLAKANSFRTWIHHKMVENEPLRVFDEPGAICDNELFAAARRRRQLICDSARVRSQNYTLEGHDIPPTVVEGHDIPPTVLGGHDIPPGKTHTVQGHPIHTGKAHTVHGHDIPIGKK